MLIFKNIWIIEQKNQCMTQNKKRQILFDNHQIITCKIVRPYHITLFAKKYILGCSKSKSHTIFGATNCSSPSLM